MGWQNIRDPFGWLSKKAIGSWPNWLHLFWRSNRKGFQQANMLFNPEDVGNRWTANCSRCASFDAPRPKRFCLLKLKLFAWNPWLGGIGTSHHFIASLLFQSSSLTIEDLEKDLTTQHQKRLGSYLKRILQRSIKSVLEVTWRFRTCQQDQGRRTLLPPQPLPPRSQKCDRRGRKWT